MVRTTLDFQVSDKKKRESEVRKAEREAYRETVERGDKEVERELEGEKRKKERYQKEIVTLWDRS